MNPSIQHSEQVWGSAFRAALRVGSWILILGASQAAQAGLEIYRVSQDEVLDQRLEARIGEQTLPLVAHRIWHPETSGAYFMEVAIGRFASDGPVEVQLKPTGRAPMSDLSWGQPLVRTVGRDIPVRHSGGALAFDLANPGQYYFSLPGLARSNGTFTVVLCADDLSRLEQTRKQFTASASPRLSQIPTRSTSQSSVIDVTEHGVHPNATLDQTPAVQALFDQHGTICFPPGVYRTGSLRIGSDTTVWLAPGAVLRAVDNEDAVGSEFIVISNAHNVKLCGPGTVDANSLSLHRRHNVHNVNISSSQDVSIEDLLIEESNSWAVHISRSDRFTARNVKVFSGKDGFDPDASRDVLIDGAFVMSADDAIAVKNRYPGEAGGKTTERITFRNSIVSSIKSALKIGTETRGPIRDVTFTNCDVFDGERGLVLYGRDGGPIERVTWRNIRLFMRDWPQEKSSGAVFDFNIERRAGPTPVRECLVENVTANWLYRSAFAGLPDAPLDGIRVRNICVKAEQPKAGKPCLFECGPNVHLAISGLTIDWQGHQAAWAGVTSGGGLSISR